MEITAAVVNVPGHRFDLESLELADPRPDEVTYRVEAAGLCHTDLTIAAGTSIPLPAVLGHEGAGVVERVGSAVRRVRPGDRIVTSFSSCGHCTYCRQGRPAYCADFAAENMSGARPDGSATIYRHGTALSANFFGQSSFATHALAAERNVVLLDDGVPFEVAAPMACGFQTGAGTVLNILPFSIDSSLLVLGAGAVGIGAVLAGAAFGARIVVVDPAPERRSSALAAGAEQSLDPAGADFAEQLRAVSQGGFDFAFDTSGNSAAQLSAFSALAQDGMLALVTPNTPQITLPVHDIVRARSVRGVVEGDSVPALFLPRLFRLWRAGRFPVEKFIQAYPMRQFQTAVDDARAGAVVKPVILPNA